MISIPRTSQSLVIGFVVVLLMALLAPIATRAIHANPQLFAFTPGDEVGYTCHAQLSGVVQNTQATVGCVASSSPTDTSSAALLIAGFNGVQEGQTIKGRVVIEVVVARQDIATVAFQLNGPASIVYIERVARYFFMGSRNGQPIGWDTTQYPDGNYTLAATATTTSGQSSTTMIHFRVANQTQVQPTLAVTTAAVGQTAQSSTSDQSFKTLSTKKLEYGIAAHLFYTNRDIPLAATRKMGLGWIRQQIHWRDIEGISGNYAWGDLDNIVDSVNGAGLKLLLSVVRSPTFYTENGSDGMPKDPRSLGNFLAALTTRYKGKVQAIEVWNEPNLAYENGGSVSAQDAGHYVELLKEAYARIKAVDPDVYVLAGPLSSTGINDARVAVDDMTYYEALYSYQNGIIHNYMDAQAVHPGGAANPPDTMWPNKPSTARGWNDNQTFYFRHIEDVRALMEKHGMADRQIWITEFGWATPNNSPGYEFGNQVSLDQQATYIVDAMRRTREQYSWVGVMFIWNLNFAPLATQNGNPLDQQGAFSVLDGNYRPRPAYDAIKFYMLDLQAHPQSITAMSLKNIFLPLLTR